MCDPGPCKWLSGSRIEAPDHLTGCRVLDQASCLHLDGLSRIIRDDSRTSLDDLLDTLGSLTGSGTILGHFGSLRTLSGTLLSAFQATTLGPLRISPDVSEALPSALLSGFPGHLLGHLSEHSGLPRDTPELPPGFPRGRTNIVAWSVCVILYISISSRDRHVPTVFTPPHGVRARGVTSEGPALGPMGPCGPGICPSATVGALPLGTSTADAFCAADSTHVAGRPING